MTNDTKTCAQRIHDEFQSRNEMLDEIYENIENPKDGDNDEAWNEYNEFILDVEEYKVIKILLSTGGPSDWIEVKMNEEDDIIGMQYHFADWFDHASINITKDTYMWQYAAELADRY